MTPPDVLVVGETPSLGRAIVDLLESDGIGCRLVSAPGEATAQGPIGAAFPVIVSASNAPFSVTAHLWIRGELPGTELVVVGARDPAIAIDSGIHIVTLPIPPRLFLRLVRTLLDQHLPAHDRAPVASPAPSKTDLPPSTGGLPLQPFGSTISDPEIRLSDGRWTPPGTPVR